MNPSVPPYFDFLIDDFRRGKGGRFVHLGYWDVPVSDDAAPIAAEFEQAQVRLNQVLLGMSDLRAGQSVLDAGCGFGGTLQTIDRSLDRMHLTGINIDPRQLEICRQIQPSRANTLHWELADACALPFSSASFDRVLCFEAMFHFSSRRTFFAEAARVLKPGGALIASDIIVASSARPFDAQDFPIEAWIRDGFGPWPEFWGQNDDCLALTSTAGLICSEMRDATANTRPSHRFTAPRELDDHGDPGDATMRAALMLRWLHRNGHLQYPCMRFDKPA